jgi:cytochrome c biogenesis factor
VGSFTAAVTTDISPWISCGLSMAAIFACLLLLWVMPETPKSIHFSSGNHQNATPRVNESSVLLGTESPRRNSQVDGVRSSLSDMNILLAIPVFLTGSLRFTILNVLIQYGSNRFNLKISTGALFYTETALVNMLLFLFAVPLLSSCIRKKHNVRPQTIDLFMSRTCVCLLCVGCLLIGLSPSSTILPIGN